MNGVYHDPATDRRGKIIGRLVEHYQAVPEPDKWLQAMTLQARSDHRQPQAASLQALRALDRADLSPADKSPARKEIHAIHREVASKARALKLSRHAAGLHPPDPPRTDERA